MFCHVKGFAGNAKNFRLVRNYIYKHFLYANHPNDSLIMKVIDQIIELCIKYILFLLECYDQIFISFLLFTDLDAVFNGLY